MMDVCFKSTRGSGFPIEVPEPAVSASLENMSEMQIRPHPKPIESETPGLGPNNLCFINSPGDSDTHGSLRTTDLHD